MHACILYAVQVKVRGYRIELGEVEAALRRQPGVRNAAALVVRNGSGANRLVAYVAPDNVHAGRLRADLQALLPTYMLPEVWEAPREDRSNHAC